MTAIPMLGSLGSLAVMLSISGTSAGPGGRSRMMLAGSVFLLTTVILVGVQLDRAARARRSRVHVARATYLRYLDDVRCTIREHASAQRRRLTQPGRVRVGHASAPIDLDIEFTPGGPRADPVATAAARRLVEIQARQPGLPVTIDLDTDRWITITGEDDLGRALARAIVCAAVGRRPGQLMVAIAAEPDRLREWDWLKWLPSAVALPQATDVSLLARAAPDHRVLLVTDGTTIPNDDLPATVSVIDLGGQPRGKRIHCSADSGQQLDQLSTAVAEATARRLGSLGRVESDRGRTPDLPTLLGLPPQGAEPEQGWTRGQAVRALCVPIGVTDDASTLELDLKESAAGGMGPHGLIVGATGSGKSELLRTLVLGLTLTHDPSSLNLVLVDFKGGATFAGFAGLPHVSAVVTNLSAETALVERMEDALEGEVIRRQHLLRAAGGFASVRDYDAARASGRELPALPALLIVIDEFTELLNARPEFLEIFVSIGRVGRSLGMHLVLASQRVEEGRLRGLEAHLSYRIALRTFSEAESRAVIGVPDAARLPASPGVGLLRSDPATLRRFSTACVSGAMQRPGPGPTRIEPLVLRGLALDQRDGDRLVPDQQTGPSLLEATVASMVGKAVPSHRIWLPPLGPQIALGQLFDDLVVDTQHGLTSPTWRGRGPLILPLGAVDRPRDQRRDVLTADLRGAGGHLVVVGAPRSGKTTLLQTFVLSTAVLNTPAEARFFIIDAGGGLAALRALPHLAGFAGVAEVDVVRRIVDEVGTLITEPSAGTSNEAVFLVIDGWDRLPGIHHDLQSAIHDLGARGLAANVHLVVSTNRWGDLRIATRELFGTRIELRQGDPLDSEIDRRAATAVPPSQPGRGIVAGPWQVLAALPRLGPTDDLGASVRRVADAWTGPPAVPLRLLPTKIELSGLPETDLPRIAIRERDHEVVQWDAKTDQHLLVFGDAGSGKTNLLRTIGREITRLYTPTEAQLVVVSCRRSLHGEFDDAYLLHALSTPDETRRHASELTRHLSPHLTRPTGPELFVLVDDHDLVGGPDSPLAPLIPLLFQAREVGLHLLLARRASGGSRALFEPAVQALRDLGAPGVLLSGNPNEGPLLGAVSPSQAPPGRARWVTADSVDVCQAAWTEPAR